MDATTKRIDELASIYNFNDDEKAALISAVDNLTAASALSSSHVLEQLESILNRYAVVKPLVDAMETED